MKIEVNISKVRFFVILFAILLLGSIFVVYAFGTSNPSNFGHSPGEIDWSQTIPSNINVGGSVGVSGQAALSSDTATIYVGDLIGADGVRQLSLRAGDADRMVINTLGDIGIGTTAPTSKLHVAGNAKVDGSVGVSGQAALSSDTATVFVGDLDAVDGLRQLSLRAGGADRMVINTAGDAGIGTTFPTSRLHVVGGNARVEGNVDVDGGMSIGAGGIIVYVSGTNPSCGTGNFFMRNWGAKTCGGGPSCTTCTLAVQWSGTAPYCVSRCTVNIGSTTVVASITQCKADSWTEAFCIG